jgi:hypothetical protein
MSKEIKLEERQCWYKEGVTCHCDPEGKGCVELAFANAKLLYCNDKECKWNIDLPYKYEVYRGRGHKPFADDYFTGVCGRGDVGMARQVIRSSIKVTEAQKFTSCRVRADRTTTTPHMPDPDKIEHHVYDDPKDSDFDAGAFGIR